ncbi:phage portal protein [Terrisporobacter sp.]|uniref:phage portal protein n=1 Tax=Terrisporobacter sp. TaxID=1965305 RepID=UPI002897A138|nr:phage portal protein [Terrisporobacter sp.]
MKILRFFRDMFGSKYEVKLNEKLETIATSLAIEEFAINSAINLITGCISKCEFRTYINSKEVKGNEYYLWNIEPNKNQNSSEFIQQFLYKLLKENECLIVESHGELFVADSFYRNEFAIKEDYFEGVTIKDFTFDKTFRMSDVLYFRLNNEDIRRLISDVSNGYNELLNLATGKYKRSGGRKGKVELESISAGNEEEKQAINELFEKRFKTYFEAENAVITIPNGVKYTEQNGEGNKKSTSEITDIQNITKEIFDRVAQAYKIPTALLRGDIADVDKITENLLSFGIDPLVDMLVEEINRKRFGKKAYLKGSYLDIDTTCIKHIDVFAIADKIDKLIADGVYSIDGILRKIGEPPLKTEWSEKHWITKNYSGIENLEGGEVDDKTNMDDTAINKT